MISRRAGSVLVALVILTGACSQGDEQGASKAPVVDASGDSTTTTAASPGDGVTTSSIPAAVAGSSGAGAEATPSSTVKPGSAGGQTTRTTSGPAARSEPAGTGGQAPAQGRTASAPQAGVAPAPAPGPGQPYKVGGIFPLSGGISALGRPAEQAARAYIQSVNDAGGVNGRRIEFITEDDGGDPNRTRAAAEKLVERDG
ncbi:MAG TPA: ABC transporter substrate-binding protein, partial [Acidimicrobiia bacterium]